MTFNIVGEISQVTVKKFFRFVDDALVEDVGSATIRVFSIGGDADAALAISGLMKATNSILWTVEGYGSIESAAAIILCAGDVRKLSHSACVMIHPGKFETKGNAWNIRDYSQHLLDYEHHWANLTSKYVGNTPEFWLVKTEKYMFAEECLKLNIATELI